MAPLPLGILALAGAGAGAAAFDHLVTTTLSSNTNDITFSNLDTLAADYAHLRVMMFTRSATGNYQNDYLNVQIAGGTSNYDRTELSGNGTSVAAEGANNQSAIRIGWTVANGAQANYFNGTIMDLYNRADSSGTGVKKTVRSISGFADSGNNASLFTGVSNGTSANSLKFFIDAGTPFASKTQISIYGIRG
jgi:hypothetical protein